MHKTRRMNNQPKKKRKKACIYVAYDKEQALQDPAYGIRWKLWETDSKRVSEFLQEMIDKHEVPKRAIYETAMISNKTLEKYLHIPEDHCLSQDAMEHLAVAIALLVPILNDEEEKKLSAGKKGGLKSIIRFDGAEEKCEFASKFHKAFGSFAYDLMHEVEDIKELASLNEFYHHKFSNQRQGNIHPPKQ